MRYGLEIWIHKESCRLPNFKCSKAKINTDESVALESGNKQMKKTTNNPQVIFQEKNPTKPLASLAKTKFPHSEGKFLSDIAYKKFLWLKKSGFLLNVYPNL